jgi:type I restriction enzyme S subunit
MNKLPKDWDITTFQEIFEYCPKTKHKAGEGLDHGKYRFFTSSPIQSKYLDKSEFLGEYLILGTGGMPSIHYCNDAFATSTDCFVVRSMQKDISTKFFYYFLKAHIEIIEKGFRGAGLKHLSRPYLNNVKIPKPPLETQKRIVKILEKAEKLMELRENADKLANRFLESVFNERFGDPVQNEKDWEVFNISEISEKTQIGPFGTQLHVSDYVDNGIPLINPTHIIDRKIKPDYHLSVSKDKYDELSNYYLKAGDVIMGRRGEMGRCALVTNKEAGWLCGTGSLFIRPKEGIDPTFLLFCLTHYSIKKVIENSSQGVTMSNLNLAIVNNLKVIVPPFSNQQNFTRNVKYFENMQDRQRQSKQAINNMLNMLMQNIFKGELTC